MKIKKRLGFKLERCNELFYKKPLCIKLVLVRLDWNYYNGVYEAVFCPGGVSSSFIT